MALDRINPGKDVPHDINVVIEIPAQSDPVKYEVDKESGEVFVDRFMGTAMYYPCNYGYIPQTLSEDGDPVDVLVVTPHPLISGSIIRSRPVGMLKMMDEAGRDSKILAVPADQLTDLYRAVDSVRDLPGSLIAQIAHFFEHYKDLEPGKWVKTDGWVGPAEAKAEVLASIERYQLDAGQPVDPLRLADKGAKIA
ncbi:MAG: inorganic diphosphatase [Gammaproteobacteria bacterium]|nr:inorganic diphosphatase [Gammaproteobacteria bacterium]